MLISFIYDERHVIVEVKKVDWFLSLRDELEMLARKLPHDFLDEQNIQDIFGCYNRKIG